MEGCKVKENEGKQLGADSKNFPTEEKKCRRGMQKESNMVRCTLKNGSAWSTETKYVRWYKGTFDIFFGIEHRMRKEEMEEQFQQRSQTRLEICRRCSKDHQRES